jgi:hypothetical protein
LRAARDGASDRQKRQLKGENRSRDDDRADDDRREDEQKRHASEHVLAFQMKMN